jgi:hypothetical protein
MWFPAATQISDGEETTYRLDVDCSIARHRARLI